MASRAADRYTIDLSRISLEKFRSSLERRPLVPSRRLLKEKAGERFDRLQRTGIQTMAELVSSLASKNKLETVARETGIDSQYLILLKREAGSYKAAPVRLDAFPGISTADCDGLTRLGITNTKQLFNAVAAGQPRSALAARAGLAESRLDELVSLSDLCRLYGVGPAFARLLYDIGITSVEEMKSRTSGEIVQIYERETGKKADFAASDIDFTLELAAELEEAEDSDRPP